MVRRRHPGNDHPAPVPPRGHGSDPRHRLCHYCHRTASSRDVQHEWGIPPTLPHAAAASPHGPRRPGSVIPPNRLVRGVPSPPTSPHRTTAGRGTGTEPPGRAGDPGGLRVSVGHRRIHAWQDGSTTRT
ncbi:hypothetical protein SGM_0465 [Streptomyces griseoaurantiacus M045]|uniref:Uncharacterized protein n=1 Tax=Streptomyces griseoaurantiacus M045 TaxID=996637 RepID=F3NAT1_9ACTN|nr:hypothetical protein SGM_0465 [Streptomyces griseoaurantiacus M045]